MTMTCLLLGAASNSRAQGRFSGELETFFSAMKFKGPFIGRERGTRLLGVYDTGAWSFQLSYFLYPLCEYREIGESGVTYRAGSLAIRAGRFLPAIGQSEWYQQWHSGFIIVPQIEYTTFDGVPNRTRPVNGIDADYVFGKFRAQAGVHCKDLEEERLLASNLEQSFVRLQGYEGNVVAGVSYWADTKTFGSNRRNVTLDVRWTIPNLNLRGEYSWNHSATNKVHGGFIEAHYRLPGSEDVTLLGRQEFVTAKPGRTTGTLISVVGVKYRLPFDVFLAANYTFGPDMNRLFRGGGWSFLVYRSYRF